MKIRNIRNFIFGTLRGRLILSVAIVNAVIMTLFIIYLTSRQRIMLIDSQEEEAIALSQTLSTSAAGWLATYDIAGLQELVNAQLRYPELIFAMLTDNEGHVLAHTDKSKNGKFLLDLPAEPRLTIINNTSDLVDIAVPAMLGGKHVGWARIGLGPEIVGTKLAEISRIGALYALAAILIGSVIVWLMGRRITRRLYAIQDTIKEIGAGNRSARSHLSGTDEAAMLANEFNTMLDALSERDTELGDSETRFRKLFNLAAIPMCLVDKDGMIGAFNERFIQTFGYTLEDLPTIKEWWQLAFPDPEYRKWAVSTWEDAVQRYLEEKTDIGSIEYKVTCKRGGVRTVVISGTTINNDILATFFDITERKSGEEALRRNEARQGKMVANIGDVIDIIDRNGITRYKSPNIEKWFGWRPEDIVGKSTWENIHPEDLDSVQKIFGALLSEPNATNTTECRYLCKDGSYKWIEFTGINLLHDPDIQGLLGNFHDITERKQAELNLKEKNEYIEAQNEKYILINKELAFQNEEKEKRAAELIIANKELFLQNDEKEKRAAELVIANKELAFQNDEKEKRAAELIIANKELIFQNDEKENRAAELILANKELVFQNEEKEKRAAELVIAKEKAEESDRLKSSFLANMSHEVRTPLNGIIGFSELLADPYFEEDQKNEFIQNIIISGNNLLSIISDIMDISKMESGEITIRNSQINAQKFISTIKEQFSFQTKEKKLELQLYLPNNNGETVILADVDRLRQIFNNLVNNAIKFTANGRIEMGYQTKGKMVEFYVRDTGIGIPAEYHELIFERFIQVEIATTRKFGGNGLGLAISKNLVELMGGKIWLESESGKGSVFYFTLPTYNSEL